MYEQYNLTYPFHVFYAFTHALPEEIQRNTLDESRAAKIRFDEYQAKLVFKDARQRLAQASQEVRAARVNGKMRDPYGVRLEIVNGLNDLVPCADFYIGQAFPADPQNADPRERFDAFKRLNNVFDSYYNGLRKYAEKTDIDVSKELTYFEALRREIRAEFIKDISKYETRLPVHDPSRLPDYMERVLYNAIDDANISSRNASHIELSEATSFRGDFDNPVHDSYEINCAHVAPVTVAIMYGAHARAAARGVDYQQRRRVSEALPEVYERPWQNVRSLDELFDVIEGPSWPDNTYAFVYWAYTHSDSAHITVAGKVNSRACIIEGQNQSVTTRDSQGQFNVAIKHREDNTVSFAKQDPTILQDIKFMHVLPAQRESEIERVNRAWESMYPNRARPEKIVDPDITLDREKIRILRQSQTPPKPSAREL